MLSSFSLAEALDWLGRETTRKWTESEFFDLCIGRGIALHAAPPLDAKVSVVELDPAAPGGARAAMRLGWRKAVLYPFNVGQLWQIGETEPTPVWEPMHAADTGRWAVFDPPVRVRREHLTIRREALLAVFEAWRSPSPVEQILRAETPPPTAGTQAAKRTAQHRESVLRALEAAGYTLPALPPYRNGRVNEAKRAAREFLVPKAMTDGMFMTAWQECLDLKDIEQQAERRP
jgi:hypothetical protein